MITPKPLVTVNILSYNRKDELRNTLLKVYEQEYKNIEVIVVDNASSDGSPEMVRREFPEVQLIKLAKNIGIAGWNEGFKVAKGKYVLVLDDDSYPLQDTIMNGIIKFSRDDNIRVVAYSVFDVYKNETDSLFLDGDRILYFIGCAALIKKSIFYDVGYFDEMLFIYEHEIDFSIRVINAGHSITLLNECGIIHARSNINRKIRKNIDHRRVYFRIRNTLIILTKYFPIRIVGMRIIRIIMGKLWFGIRKNCIVTISKAILNYLFILPSILSTRSIVTSETIEYYKYGKFAGGFFFMDDFGGNKRPKWLSH